MKRTLNQLLIALALLFISIDVTAQSDSLLDLGRIKIHKDFTQSITIKGSELERIPFATISDVLAPWLQGTFSSKTNLVFVIDGNLVNDVNAWSIHDIEEITLVQNALVRVNGAVNQQQLVLVKTKRNKTGQGITVAGASHLVKNKFTEPYQDEGSETHWYHQYHVGAWKNFRNVQVGASANFVRDVMPRPATPREKTVSPQELNRFRLNAWMDAKLAEGHLLTLRLNYVPQTSQYETIYNDISITEAYYKSKQSLVNPSLKLSNRLAPGLTNEFDISYVTDRAPIISTNRNYPAFPDPQRVELRYQMNGTNKSTYLLIRERLAYSKQLNDWLLQPAINFTYSKTKLTTNNHSEMYQDNTLVSMGNSFSRTEKESYVLTPQFGLGYKNIFHILAGISTSLTEKSKPLAEGIYPFASLMVDVLRITDAGNNMSLKLFGSYTKAPNYYDDYFLQADHANAFNPTPLGTPVYLPTGFYIADPYPDDPDTRGLMAGLSFSLPAEKLRISYNLDSRKYVDRAFYYIPGTTGWEYVLTWPAASLTSHRLGISSRLVDLPGFKWSGGLNVTTYNIKLREAAASPTSPPREINDGKKLWTGGWTNSVQLGNVSLGLNILYMLNEQRYEPALGYETVKNFRVDNFHIGYRVQVAKDTPLEFYASARNPLAMKETYMLDNRKYYGAGFKLQF